MKKLIVFIPIVLCAIFLNAQSKEFKQLMHDGIRLHDSGQYKKAIEKYDEALELEPDNLEALYEKTVSLSGLGKFEEVVKICEKAVKLDGEDKEISNFYVNWGNTLDYLKNTDEAILVYDEGIKRFPDFYLLYFNKGITLTKVEDYDEALKCFEAAIQKDPSHTSSHNAIGTIQSFNKKKIPALLAFNRFLILEPATGRSEKALESINDILYGNIKKTGRKGTTIYLNLESLPDSADGPVENDFAFLDLMISLTAASDNTKENKKKNEVELYIYKMEIIFSSLSKEDEKYFGFYWEYYAPYFAELYKNGHLEAFAYYIFSSKEEKYINKWFDKNQDKLADFLVWSGKYDWKQ